MSQKKHEAEASPRAKVWVAFFLTMLGAVVSLIGVVVSAAKVFEARLLGMAAISIVAVLVTGVFTIFLAERKRGPSRLANLKNELASAYLSALDSSAFNPHVEDSR